jgi:uncharacterized caspase-like protein
MGRNWAITIGINGYRNLQWLNYAKQDAEAMQVFLKQELKIQTVYHFTDDSPAIPQDYGPDLDSFPTYATLRRFFRIRFEEPFLQPSDNLWFFFAGHGKRHDDRDYLLPIDADPGDESEKSTWIPLSYVTDRLRRSGADNVVLLIDACRSGSGRRDSSGFGQEKQQGVITLFACSPWESSYEIEELQQGAFTHALLQGLQIEGKGNCATVEQLYQHLRQTVPQVTQNYKHVQQTPYGVIEPPTKYHLILLPHKASLTDVMTLKNDAFQSEIRQEFQLAKQLWLRVLAASPVDRDAIEGIERLARVSATLTVVESNNPQEPNAKPDASTAPQSSARSTSPSQVDDDLISEEGVDYSRLYYWLKEEDWKRADWETSKLMYKIAGRTKERWLRIKDIESFSAQVLYDIDQLWMKYSSGKFGFSIQKQIWKNYGKPKSYGKNWDKFGDALGWRKDEEWDRWGYSVDPSEAPLGHFPRDFAFHSTEMGAAHGKEALPVSLTSKLLGRNFQSGIKSAEGY